MYRAITLALSVLFSTAGPLAHAAFTCPPMPTAMTNVDRNIKSDISASAGSLGKIKAGEIAIKTEIEAKNLFEKYPNVDKLVALQTMSATYCDMLKNTTAIPEIEKIARWEKFQDKVLDLRTNPPKAPRRQTQPSASSATAASITPEESRMKLGEMSMQYTPGDFVQSAKMGDLTAVKLFLTAGMDPNVTTEGETALTSAASKGHTKIVAALIKAGADVKKSDHICNALCLAVSGGHIDSLRILLDKGFDAESINDAFVNAAGTRHRDAMRLLADRGADVKKIGSHAMTFLVMRGGGEVNRIGEHDKEVSDIVKTLLDLGADPNGKGKDGWTALLGAAYGGYPSAVRLLLNRSADANAKCDCPDTDYGGSTALMLAASRGDLESVEALLAKGADIKLRNDKGQTALTVAEKKGLDGGEKGLRIVQLIKESGAR